MYSSGLPTALLFVSTPKAIRTPAISARLVSERNVLSDAYLKLYKSTSTVLMDESHFLNKCSGT